MGGLFGPETHFFFFLVLFIFSKCHSHYLILAFTNAYLLSTYLHTNVIPFLKKQILLHQDQRYLETLSNGALSRLMVEKSPFEYKTEASNPMGDLMVP